MRTVGMMLKEERQKKGFTLEQVEKSTKIRAKFLLAIEADDFRKMPSLPYLQGFIKNYSEFLGLRSTTILAIFRRQYIRHEKEQTATIEEPLTTSVWQPTQNKVIFVILSLLVIGLFSYFYIQYQKLHAPPPLTLTEPKDGQIVTSEEIAVFGDTDVDATLTINNEPILIKEDGKFFKDVRLSVGQNTLVVEATSRVGQKTTVVRTIARVSPSSN